MHPDSPSKEHSDWGDGSVDDTFATPIWRLECKLWQPVYNLSAQEVEAGDPGAKMGIQTTLLCMLEVQGDTLPQ